MLPTFITGLVGLTFATLVSATPTPINHHLLTPLNEIAVRDPLDVARDPSIEKRISADFSLDHEWHNEVLFDGKWTENGEHDAQAVSLSVVCRECWTKGDVTARLTTRDIIKPVVRLELGGVQAYVDLNVDVSASAVYAINLFTSNSPVGIGFPGLSVGLVFYVDLVFSASAVLDLDGGFYVSLEDDAFLEADVFDGDITDSLFDGIGTKSFPITVRTGNATFKAALRLRVQLGAETQIPFTGISIGGGAVAGIYANVIEFVAEIDTHPGCALETREWFNLNVGAYARAGFDLDFTTIGVAPTVSTTLFDSPTFTQCWIDGKPSHTAVGDGAIVSPEQTVSAVTSAAELPSLPAFAGGPTPIVIRPGPADSNTETLVVATTLSTPGDFPVLQTPPPIQTPSAVAQIPKGNSSFPTPDGPKLITTVVYPTTEYVITRCAASVMNCPGPLESKIVVTKTLEAFTTVCPPGASVTVPPRPASIGAVSAPVIHVVTEVVRLHKLETPVVHTYHGEEKPTAQKVTVANVAPTSSSVVKHTTKVASPGPAMSELPVAVLAENHVSHNVSVASHSQTAETETPAAPSLVPTAAGSRFQGSGLLHVSVAVLIAGGLAW
jgi:hypothetical protein